MILVTRMSDGIIRLSTTELNERSAILAVTDAVAQGFTDDPMSMKAGHYTDEQGRCTWFCDVPPADGTRHKFETGQITLED